MYFTLSWTMDMTINLNIDYEKELYKSKRSSSSGHLHLQTMRWSSMLCTQQCVCCLSGTMELLIVWMKMFHWKVLWLLIKLQKLQNFFHLNELYYTVIMHLMGWNTDLCMCILVLEWTSGSWWNIIHSAKPIYQWTHKLTSAFV